MQDDLRESTSVKIVSPSDNVRSSCDDVEIIHHVRCSDCQISRLSVVDVNDRNRPVATEGHYLYPLFKIMGSASAIKSASLLV